MKGKLFYNYFENGEINIEALVRDYSAYVNKIIINKTKGTILKEDIEEIISDVFVVLWNNKGKIDKNRSVEPYISAITRNLITIKYREKCNEVNIDDIDFLDGNSIERIIENQENTRKIEEALKEISEDARMIFIMFYYKNMKVKEISKRLNYTNNNVKVILARTRKKLKKLLRDKE